jgi:hypothetical protein
MLLSKDAFIEVQVLVFKSYACKYCFPKTECDKCKKLKEITKSAKIIWQNEQSFEETKQNRHLKDSAFKRFTKLECSKCRIKETCRQENSGPCDLWADYYNDILIKLGYDH